MILRIILSLFIGGILGFDRERKNRPAGFRTYILVCLGSTIVMMTNQYVYQMFDSGDPTRLGAQVVSGVGFLGAAMKIASRGCWRACRSLGIENIASFGVVDITLDGYVVVCHFPYLCLRYYSCLTIIIA